MRKILAAAATLGLAGLGAIVPATGAQAATACDTAWHNARSGYFYAYSGYNCSGYIGSTDSWDSDYGNSSGPFQGGDTNTASSILHKGTSGMAVQVFNGTGQDWGGGHTCIKKSEYYMSSLAGHTFTSGAGVNNGISSHRWVWNSSCGKFLNS
ncbi:hypothetical protein ACFWQ6_27900 [Streptomyces coelicoflavus]|uniref:hypothetical protein n=1 Tax=Streptomyces TaxID=1883 RepID=UPI00129259B7|nr:MULTISPECIES: hypothetical protein [Streptomyces]KAF2778053.1 hypothetical protein STPH1_2714 [Streptomyces sp. OM5714]MCX5035845.1 hypothetical protein [Streptomyces coelicoflavus]NHI07662.1 hypothetical protein [Streptomyces sp. KO7888]QFX82116.1 hypothetical protein GEV49_15105 [Streptomyces sp. SYP-A7193]